MELTVEQIEFLRECLYWSEENYQERCIKYMSIPRYRELSYEPKRVQFREMRGLLTDEVRLLKKEGKRE